eukprot:TRINITY_DN50878_c0_g1_i1.p1 TRINITY_DN50878_c0_g1~~TRINITY_DN50878_c0_g1_i1.p1  ORF type:complete len:405 (+),score=76.02 TRINITY_DN50878_c0_g1_i1:76-1215(+)
MPRSGAALATYTCAAAGCCLGVALLGSAMLANSGAGSPPLPPRRCGCQPRSYSEIAKCSGGGRCIVVRNECIFTLWAVVTAGSPPTVFGDATIEPGESREFSSIPPGTAAGRVYLYYRDPAEFGQGRYSVADDGPAPAVPPPSIDWSQLVEFTFIEHPLRGAVVDYDVSYVDAAALPVLAQAHDPLPDGRGTRPGSTMAAACKRPGSTCPPGAFKSKCPTQLISEVPAIGVAQCINAMRHCEQRAGAGALESDPLCKKFIPFAKITEGVRGKQGCDVCALLGCEPGTGPFGTMSAELCMAIHRGLCRGGPPWKPGVNCPPPDATEDSWFRGLAPHNDYVKWVRERATDVFAFSYDDSVGHTQCASPQLDVIGCPLCATA